MKDSVISSSDLWFEYPDGTLALKEVNIDIYKGEYIALIGQNGSGKTTLVKHFNGLLKPSKGDLIVFGTNTKEASTAQLSQNVGYVFQNPMQQMVSTTVERELAFGPKNLGLPPEEIEERVEESLKLMKIEHLRFEHPFLTSRGERQRVAIASILTMKPKVIILDEPTTGQDLKNLEIILKTIDELNTLGHTIIIVTHNMRVVAEHAERVIVMLNSKILIDAPVREAFATPSSLEKAFITPPQITRFGQALSDEGLPRDILTVQKMYDFLKKRLTRVPKR